MCIIITNQRWCHDHTGSLANASMNNEQCYTLSPDCSFKILWILISPHFSHFFCCDLCAGFWLVGPFLCPPPHPPDIDFLALNAAPSNKKRMDEDGCRWYSADLTAPVQPSIHPLLLPELCLCFYGELADPWPRANESDNED